VGSFLRPVGSEPPAVYWRRRILVFGIPLVLIGFTAYACSGSGGGGGNGAKGTASATPTNSSAIITPGPGSTASLPPINSYPVTGPTGSSTATSTAGSGSGGSSGGSGSGSGGGSGSGSGSGGSVGGVPVGSTGCVLSVTVQLDKTSTSGLPTYPAGQNPTFNVIVKNSGTQNCMFDVSGKGIVVTVTPVGSSTAAWTSATCAGVQDVRVLGPGDGYTDPVKWARETSESNCPSNPPVVANGSYTVSAAVSGVSAASVQFTLQ
jgi:hypothetical protein